MAANEEEVRENQRGVVQRLKRVVLRCVPGGCAADERPPHKVRKDAAFHNYMARIVASRWFHGFIMLTIFLDTLLSALETNHHVKLRLGSLLQVADELFVGVYATEFLAKVYVEPVRFWKSKTNVFDALLLAVSFPPMFAPDEASGTVGSLAVIRCWRSLRVIKVASMPMTKVLFAALYRTLKSVLGVLCLIVLLVFFFAVVGTQCFGEADSGDPHHWGDVPSALYTLFSMVTMDGWTDFQEELDRLVEGHTRFFAIVFIVLGNFILVNMSLAVMLTEVLRSIGRFESRRQAARLRAQALKKHAMGRRHEEEMRELHQSRAGSADLLRLLLPSLKRSLCPSDLVETEDLCASLTFAHLYLISLEDQDHTTRRLRHLYGTIAATLGKMEAEQGKRRVVRVEEKGIE